MSETNISQAPVGFTVGICATGVGDDLGQLLDCVLAETKQAGLDMRKLVVVASECPGNSLEHVTRIQETESRLHLIVEERRAGKSEAINRVFDQAEGDSIVLLNSDARPEKGAIGQLIRVIGNDPEVGAVSAMPVTEGGPGLTPLLVDFLWSTHNRCSLALNHLNLANHTSDELVVFRRAAISQLPEGLVNDGAFLAATARNRGYTVKFSEAAKVKIQTPTRVSDLIGQRRRILFGHAQVWRRTGRPPRTIESLLIFSTPLGARLLVKSIASKPKFIFILPVAILSELSAAILAIYDLLRSSKRHAVWRRFS